MYFAQYLLSHVPIVGKWLLEIYCDNPLLTIDLVNNHQNISKYLFIGALGASLGNIFAELFSNF
jgi:hypothetical protein